MTGPPTIARLSGGHIWALGALLGDDDARGGYGIRHQNHRCARALFHFSLNAGSAGFIDHLQRRRSGQTHDLTQHVAAVQDRRRGIKSGGRGKCRRCSLPNKISAGGKREPLRLARIRGGPHQGLEVELVRRADLVDVTAGIVNFGVDRQWVRALFRNVPRDGFWRLVGGAVLGELRHRPASLIGVFFSPRRTRA